MFSWPGFCSHFPESLSNLIKSVGKPLNFFHSRFYSLYYRDYRSLIPSLNNERDSFSTLLLFLLNQVLKTAYDPKKQYFKVFPAIQQSSFGRDSEIFELIARSFIGVGYYLIHNSSEALLEIYLRTIIRGSHPDSRFYWGKIKARQRLVENASLITGLLLNPAKLWEKLEKQDQQNFIQYLKSSLNMEFYPNNWLWFKIFHYLFLEKNAQENFAGEIGLELARINSFYQGDGWYNDGLPEGGRGAPGFCFDHYNSWAMHYYGLLFCYLAGENYEPAKKVLKQRAQEFFQNYFFTLSCGEGLPIGWGRSLLYRFAVLSCIGPGLAQGLIPKANWPELKKMVISTINNFFKLGILDQKGLLTMGYVKPTLRVLEPYSCFGSPYWALKAFSILLLAPEHPFWQINNSASPSPPAFQEKTIPAIKVYLRKEKDSFAFMLNGGINSKIFPLKYNRFAYSNLFPASLDSSYLDHCFIFFFRGQKFIKNLIKEVKIEAGNLIQVHWGNDELKQLEVYSSILPVKSGYLLISNIFFPGEIGYLYAGFNLAGGLKRLKKAPDCIELDSGVYLSRFRVFSPPGILGYRRLSAGNNLTGQNSVIPFFRSKTARGRNQTIFYLQAGLSGQLAEPRIKIDQQTIQIQEDSKLINLREKEFSHFFHFF